jgi:hypothetical protein
MTQPDTGGQDDRNDLGVTEDEAMQLLGTSDDGGEGGDEPKGSARSDTDDSKLADELAKWKSLARKHEKSYKDASSKLSEYENASKSDLERWEERATNAETRAGTAEAKAKALEIAIERAPEHATLAQVRAVAKRVRGEDDEALEKDADELFELLAPTPSEPKPGSKTSTRPQPRLKGGTAEPDEEPEENDPRKLAALLPRRR